MCFVQGQTCCDSTPDATSVPVNEMRFCLREDFEVGAESPVPQLRLQLGLELADNSDFAAPFTAGMVTVVLPRSPVKVSMTCSFNSINAAAASGSNCLPACC